MSARANYFKLGLFVIAGLVVLIAGLLVLGAGDALKETITIETCIHETVQGLDVGAPVKLRGVKIGEVQSIHFSRDVYRLSFTYTPAPV